MTVARRFHSDCVLPLLAERDTRFALLHRRPYLGCQRDVSHLCPTLANSFATVSRMFRLKSHNNRLKSFNDFNEGMAHPAGFEPATFAFGGRHSIQLSYGCFGRD